MYDCVLLLIHSMNGRISAAPRAQLRPRLNTQTGTTCSHIHKKTCILLLLLHLFNGLFSRTTWVSWNQKGKTSLDLNEARDDKVLGCSGISWTICKHTAPCSRQIITPTPHYSIFTGWMIFLMPNQQCQSTEGIA